MTSSRPDTGTGGLTAQEVAERVAAGQINRAEDAHSRTMGQIVRANVFTRFNAILGGLFLAVLATGHVGDALFGVVLVSNALIGIVQETRAKRTLDRLAVLTAPVAHVMRDGAVADIPVDDVVLDDLLELRSGDQVPADGTIRTSEGLEIDESLLTGESEPVAKQVNDEVLSGSIVVAGQGRFQTTAVGSDAYAHRIASEARRFTLVASELMASINRVLVWITWALIPVGILLAISQWNSTNGWQEAVRSTVAGLSGMVPEGLVLLTSITFAAAAVTLARRNVLLQELPAVEVLARVDHLCLDKTGTLTDGAIAFDQVIPLVDEGTEPIREALGALADDPSGNATLRAIAAEIKPPGWQRTTTVAFSSARKWSGASFADHGTWVLGAPEMVTRQVPPQAAELAAEGRRTLVLAHSSASLDGDQLPSDVEVVALVVLAEQVRPDASETLAYFAEQGVSLTVISGDNPATVAAVARQAGLPDNDTDAVDTRNLSEQELADALVEHRVFGRVTPGQKRQMVGALQAQGHVVAMTGDGVNDALALKDADLGVAMGSGAPATRAVAQLVLLDGKFASMPAVVAEGRRVIANVERVSNLFLTKTVYATVMALAVGIARVPFPLLPRHLTLISAVSIGIPGFFLALAPNKRRYVPGFLPRVARFVVPAGVVSGAAVLAVYGFARADNAPLAEARTAATIVLGVLSLWVLYSLTRPLVRWQVALVLSMAGLMWALILIPSTRKLFELDLPAGSVWLMALAAAVIGVVLLEAAWRLAAHFVPVAEAESDASPQTEPASASSRR